MFQNPKSWAPWTGYFESRGFHCVTPAWPFHEGEPATLRAAPPRGLGELHLDVVIDAIKEAAARLADDLILIGHSVGGLIVQKLISEKIGSLGVAISSVAPNRMLSFDWSFFKNSAVITNPLKGDSPFPMDAATFHAAFANTLTRREADQAWQELAVYDSRNVLRECMGETGTIDLNAPHAPLLFIAGDKDEIVPSDLCEKNAKAYTDNGSITAFQEFKNRSHFICAEPGWEEVAGAAARWIDAQRPAWARRAS